MVTQEKHIRPSEQSDPDKVKNSLKTLYASINQLIPKRQNIISDWICTWARYLGFEQGFKPGKLRDYRRGEIIHVNFGFNVGNEFGGTHYAVVVDRFNSRENGCVVVVPISSLKNGKTRDSLHNSEVYLGQIIPDSDSEAYAIPLQLRSISKIRIIKPTGKTEAAYKLPYELMSEIDKKIIKLFTNKDLTKL
ncbi:MAG: type II toxin-antitoxin system PemK/MazF family toxin [Ruminococcus sp.]|nr:type II toxin-antitoxin system PemK/MazF family toxin [Ruminococcus sp.]